MSITATIQLRRICEKTKGLVSLWRLRIGEEIAGTAFHGMSPPPTQAHVQAIMDKLNELMAGLQH